MSTAAVMVARDEADVIEAVVRHTLGHVDEMIAVDHRSIDGTREILRRLARRRSKPRMRVHVMDDRGLWGDKVWTSLAREAFDRGHEWVLIVDADDVWYTADDPTVRVADFLDSMNGDTLAVRGASFTHVPTARDNSREKNPLRRIGWRQRVPDSYKVACRLRSDFSYAKHEAWYNGHRSAPTGGLALRHFTIRTAAQLVRKVRNGMDAASEAAGLPPGYDEGWAIWRGMSDAEIKARFRSRYFSPEPESDGSLVYDPAPVMA